MNLATRYLGLKLRTPLVMAASPLSEDLDNLKRMEDAGASAIVLHSLFEEQLRREPDEMISTAGKIAPLQPDEYRRSAEDYLRHIWRAKAATRIPIIASLNGSTKGGWTEFARQMQHAGADAIELNLYHIPTDPDLAGAEVEESYLEILRGVKVAVKIPVAVKLSPFFSNFANLAKRFDEAGANGLVLFNRFYQPDIDLETLTVKPNLLLSTSAAARLPLRWIAILYGRLSANLAATSGIHSASDVLKMLLAGADVTMLCSTVLRHGFPQIALIESELKQWLEEHDYESVAQIKGGLSQKNCAEPDVFERVQYLKALCAYKV